MGILNRLESVIKSYLNDKDERLFGRESGRFSDPDVDAAFDELNDYLNGNKGGPRPGGENSGRGGTRRRDGQKAYGQKPGAPESLRPDFAELGVSFGASADDCKTAYKKLLKIHHPDRHAGHPGNFKKATEKSARINSAYDRIEKWRRDQG
jgi:DnaJ-domain-containing protein 1